LAKKCSTNNETNVEKPVLFYVQLVELHLSQSFLQENDKSFSIERFTQNSIKRSTYSTGNKSPLIIGTYIILNLKTAVVVEIPMMLHA
jgi:hypothetical protein